MSWIRRALPVPLLLLALIFAGRAAADPVIVGSPLTANFEPSPVDGEGEGEGSEAAEEAVATVANTRLGEPGAKILSPITGTVTSWRLVDAAGGPFRLRVLRPLVGDIYTAVGTSAPEIPASYALQSFNTSLPIQAGDLIGLDNARGSDELGIDRAAPGSGFSAWLPPLQEGESRSPTLGGEDTAGTEVAFDAIVEAPTPTAPAPTATSPATPAPVVYSVGPTSGSFKGGTTVTITGTGLGGATAVSFGSFAPTVLTPISSTQLQVVAPPLGHPGAVPVTVTTTAGTSAASTAAQFLGTACKVPKLRGRTLAGAKKVLRKRDCRVGTVTHKNGGRHRAGRVLHQRSGAGKNLAPGTKVTLIVGQHRSN